LYQPEATAVKTHTYGWKMRHIWGPWYSAQ